MSVDHEITKRAADGSLTIAELKQFLEEFGKAATSAEYPTNGYGLKVKVRSGLSGGIKSVTVKIPGGDERK